MIEMGKKIIILEIEMDDDVNWMDLPRSVGWRYADESKIRHNKIYYANNKPYIITNGKRRYLKLKW